MTGLGQIYRRLAFAAVITVVMQSAGAQGDASLVQAKALVDSRQAQAAYALLIPELDRRAGDPSYDYVLALAALDSGHVAEGVFALERVLAVDPGHPQARAELARAYLLLGELDSARREFESAKAANPPREVQATIDRYLAEIDRRQGGPRGTMLRGYIAFTVGYDNNVNGAQDASSLNLPAFAAFSATGDGTVQISSSGIAQSDTYGNVSAGGSLFHRLGPQLALIANAALSQRWNQSERAFDTGDGNGSLGVIWKREQDVFTAALQGNRFMLNRDRYRDSVGAVGQWRRHLNALTSVAGFVQATALSFDTQRIRNANRYTVGGSVTRALGENLKSRATLGIYGGNEQQRASGRDHLGHSFMGVSASVLYELQFDVSVFANLGVERRNYGGTDPNYLTGRDDTFVRAGGGIDYGFARHWNLSPGIYYSRNNSNLELNEYDRLLLSLTLRRDFE